MKKCLILLLFLLVGCSNKTVTVSGKVPFNTNVFLKDIIKIENGYLENPDMVINETEIGIKKMEVSYYNFENKLKQQFVDIEVVDKEEPIIFYSNKYYVELGKEINLLDKPICGDNASRNVKLELIGEYDINSIGEYPLKFIVSDESNNKKEVDFSLTVTEKMPTYTAMPDVKIEDFIKKHKNENTKIGIDVSVWQEDIDFKKVKEAGVEFVIIRMGYGHKNGENIMDTKFEENMKKAKEAELPIGVYFYSYAKSKEEAVNQANWVVDNLKGEKLNLPIVFDWEIWNQFSNLSINFLDLNNIALSYLDTVTSKGYKAMQYSSMNYLNKIWELDNYPTWLAHYTKNTDKSSYSKDYYMWQATDKGKVDGIKGYVDLNVLYE